MILIDYSRVGECFASGYVKINEIEFRIMIGCDMIDDDMGIYMNIEVYAYNGIVEYKEEEYIKTGCYPRIMKKGTPVDSIDEAFEDSFNKADIEAQKAIKRILKQIRGY